jgi:uncharacterized protein (TIGR02145 family)
MKKRKTVQMLLVAALAGLSINGYAQGKVCSGNAYEIVELQAPSDPSAYKWFEDGTEISGATAAGYIVSTTKPLGKYTYVRQSKKEGCDEWSKSNAYTVEVITCGTLTNESGVGAKGILTDPRDNKVYKTVKMPDGNIWMAENLNYQVGMTHNAAATVTNGATSENSVSNSIYAIGSYWCRPSATSGAIGDKNMCNVLGAYYSWHTAYMPDGKGEWNPGIAAATTYAVGNPILPLASHVRGVCPPSWHLPSYYEWFNLVNEVNPVKIDMSTLKNYLDFSDNAQHALMTADISLTQSYYGAWNTDKPLKNANATGLTLLATSYAMYSGWAGATIECSLWMAGNVGHSANVYVNTGGTNTQYLTFRPSVVRCVKD